MIYCSNLLERMIKRLITRLEFVKDVSIAVLLDKVSNVSRDEYFVRK